MTAHLSACRILSLAAALWLCPDAHAQLYRTYLASDGSDANPCTLTQPCRLLPAALNAVKDGGEVWMLDSANYNVAKVVIAKSVTIMAVPGAVGSFVASGGPAIEVPERPNTPEQWGVTLRNLAIRPVDNSDKSSGIAMTRAAVALDNCSIAEMRRAAISATGGSLRINSSTLWSGEAVVLALDRTGAIIVSSEILGDAHFSGSRVAISNSVLEGRLLLDGASAVISRTTIVGSISATNNPGGSAKVSMVQSTLSGQFSVAALSGGPSLAVSVHQSQIIDPSPFGLFIETHGGGTVFVSVTDSLVANKSLAAIFARSDHGDPPSRVWVSGSTITDSEAAFMNVGFIFESAGNNALRGNAQDVYGAVTVVPLK